MKFAVPTTSFLFYQHSCKAYTLSLLGSLSLSLSPLSLSLKSPPKAIGNLPREARKYLPAGSPRTYVDESLIFFFQTLPHRRRFCQRPCQFSLRDKIYCLVEKESIEKASAMYTVLKVRQAWIHCFDTSAVGLSSEDTWMQ